MRKTCESISLSDKSLNILSTFSSTGFSLWVYCFVAPASHRRILAIVTQRKTADGTPAPQEIPQTESYAR